MLLLPILAFGPALENPSTTCPPHTPLPLNKKMEAADPKGAKPTLSSAYYLSHLGLMFFALLGILNEVAPHAGYLRPLF